MAVNKGTVKKRGSEKLLAGGVLRLRRAKAERLRSG
jgi:hypothetical protein